MLDLRSKSTCIMHESKELFLPILPAGSGIDEKKRPTLRSTTAKDTANAVIGMSDGKFDLQSSDDEDDNLDWC